MGTEKVGVIVAVIAVPVGDIGQIDWGFVEAAVTGIVDRLHCQRRFASGAGVVVLREIAGEHRSDFGCQPASVLKYVSWFNP
jgi:hypothetical protein